MADATYGPKVYRDQGGNRQVIASGGTLLAESGATVDLSAATVDLPAASVQAADLATNLKTGFLPIPLTAWREVSSDATMNGAANGGLLASDTTPIFERVNGATDKQLRLHWAASNTDEIAASVPYPPDLDDTAAVVFNVRAVMAGATNTPVLAIGAFEAVGDTNAGGNTAALSAAVQHLTVSIAAGDVGAYPKELALSIVPGAHGTDALYVYSTWLTYTRKS